MEYNRSIGESIKKMLKRFEKWGEEKRKREYVLIRADFNAKRGKERGGIEGEETRMEEEKKRKSKDEKINREEKRLVKFVEEIGRVIFNRNKRLRGRRVYKSFTAGKGKEKEKRNGRENRNGGLEKVLHEAAERGGREKGGERGRGVRKRLG